MKITKQFIEILKNYVTINSSILFKPGNRISTISPLKNIISISDVDTEITNEFAIYDLSEFIGITSIIEDANVEFTDSQIIIKGNRKTLKYTFANPNVIVCSPYKTIDINPEDIITQFPLSYNEFNNISRASAILHTNDVVISGNSGMIEVAVGDVKNKTSSNYSLSIEPSKFFDIDFRKVFDIENFRLMHKDYIVSIPNKNLIEFKTSDESLSYWIAPSSN